MVKIEFIKDVGIYKKGHVVECSVSDAAQAISLGHARPEMTEEKVKFYRDQLAMDTSGEMKKNRNTNLEKIKAASFLGVGIDNYNEIKNEMPTEEFKKASKVFSAKIKLAEQFNETQPIYYDQAGLWWLWNNGKKCWELTDEITICNYLYISIGFDTTDSTERNEILQALKQVGRMYRPKEIKKSWIQFKNRIFDIENGEELEASSDYFTVNPIPYSLHPDNFTETPTMDRVFAEWVGKENVKTLYQILAYSLVPDYPIHRLFCFIGSGLNGKSCFLRIVEKFIGKSNCCSTELETLLASRFEIGRLYKKLVCIMGETNFNELSRTSMLKKLTGQDTIGFEYKHKNPFEDKNFAKIMIATNNLPETTDKTIGFYRRWLIIDFYNSFSEERDILQDIPEEEYMALATKCAMIILPDLLKERKFHNEGNIEDRQKLYEDKSNPLDKFLKENTEDSLNSDIPKWEFEKRLNEWCKDNHFRQISPRAIAKKMSDRGIQEARLWKDWYENNTATKKMFRCWVGVTWK